jgi:3-keto-disaccharide hydrolase
MVYLTARHRLLAAMLLTTCAHGTAAAQTQSDMGAPGWHMLFDGKSLDAWRGWQSRDIPKGWHIVGEALTKEGEVDDLVTRQEFGNFELALEWKIGKGGNSGIFYRGTREYAYIYWSGPEYQLLDDRYARDGRDRLTAAAAAYGLYAPPAGVVKPFGQWNTTRILVNGAHVEHWLNGKKVVEYELWSADWKARVSASKFSKYPHYGLARRGYIGIQGDHEGLVAVRNIRIRDLP